MTQGLVISGVKGVEAVKCQPGCIFELSFHILKHPQVRVDYPAHTHSRLLKAKRSELT